MTYLYNNPIISKRLSDLQKDSDAVAALTAAQASLEGEITALQNELASLGYQSSISGARHDSKRASAINEELKSKKREYANLGTKMASMDAGATQHASTYTSDLDARSQNINGGLQNV